MAEAALALAALGTMRGGFEAGAGALLALCEHLGQADLAQALDEALGRLGSA